MFAAAEVKPLQLIVMMLGGAKSRQNEQKQPPPHRDARPRSSRIKQVAQNGALVLASIVLALAAGEMTLRQLGIVPMVRSGWVWESSPLRSLQPPSAATEINALRLRGQDFLYDDQDYIVGILRELAVRKS